MKYQFALKALSAVLCLAVSGWLMPVKSVSADTRSATTVKTKILVEGTGAEAVARSRVSVHYTGWLENGAKFDSSHDRGEPFSFVLGMRQVIPGWEKGVLGMREGGKRELVIPPALAYGKRGAGGVIPPDATLRFEIELIKVDPPVYSNVDVSELRKLMARGVKVIDVRTEGEWSQTGVVEGSHLITAFDGRRNFVPEFDALLDKVVGKDEEVAIICRSGARSSAISDYLTTRRNFTNVTNVAGGMNAWTANGYPVVKP